MKESGAAMKEEKIKKMLDELADATAGPVSSGFAEEIKQRIPHQLMGHKKGMDTFSVIIDLRVSKLAAAAVIILTMILFANFLARRDAGGGNLIQDSKMLVRYLLGSQQQGGTDVLRGIYLKMAAEGKEVVYYGESVDTADSNSVLMHWKVGEGTYEVMFCDTRKKIVSADELVELQARMLQKK